MKKKDFKNEIAAMSAEQLGDKARSIAEELMKLRFRKAAGQLQQTHLLDELRRNLARVQTSMRQKNPGQTKQGAEKTISATGK